MPLTVARSGALAGLRRRWQQRRRPLLARRALARLLENPDDTAEVFVVVRALSGRSFEKLCRKVRRDPLGKRILRERRDLLSVLSDSDHLLSLPANSLGHHYARFVQVEQISAQGLVDVSAGGRADDLELVDPEAAAFLARLRDMHDLWHVVTGYSRDILGELALLAFTHQQTGNPGIGYIVKKVERRMRRGGDREISDFLREASERGRRAVLLPAADWEALLELPLDEVRGRLRVGSPVAYEQRRTADGEAAAGAASA